jgi:hypothetical protein
MEEEIRNLIWMSVALLCNFLDALFTLYAVSVGVEEANPIMQFAIQAGPGFFIMFKFILFGYAINFLAQRSPGLLLPTALIYMSIICWQIYGYFSIQPFT